MSYVIKRSSNRKYANPILKSRLAGYLSRKVRKIEAKQKIKETVETLTPTPSPPESPSVESKLKSILIRDGRWRVGARRVVIDESRNIVEEIPQAKSISKSLRRILMKRSSN